MVQNHLISQHLIIHFPTSPGVTERGSKWMSASERASKVSRVEKIIEWAVLVNEQMDEQANGWANSSVLTWQFLVVLDHSDLFLRLSLAQMNNKTTMQFPLRPLFSSVLLFYFALINHDVGFLFSLSVSRFSCAVLHFFLSFDFSLYSNWFLF